MTSSAPSTAQSLHQTLSAPREIHLVSAFFPFLLFTASQAQVSCPPHFWSSVCLACKDPLACLPPCRSSLQKTLSTPEQQLDSLPRMSDVQNAVPAAASTPQQQPQGTPVQQNAPTPASVSGAGSGDQLVCQWQNCGDRLPSAEQLYVSNPRPLFRSQPSPLVLSASVTMCAPKRF